MLNREFKGFDTAPRFDPFDNLIVWLPYGIVGNKIEAYGEHEAYVLTREELASPSNNLSLGGLDIVEYKHQTLTPATRDDVKVIGTCTGRYREEAGVFQVEALIKNRKTIDAVLKKQLVEVSASYLSSGNTRYYNHLVIVPPNLSRGGKDMALKFESSVVKSVDPTTFDSTQDNPQPNMSDKPTPLMDGQTLVDSVVAAMRTESVEIKEMLAKMREEGFQAGLAQGQTEAKITLRAEALGVVAADFQTTLTSLVEKYLPAVKELAGTTPEYSLALAEAALTVGESNMKAEAKAPAEAVKEESKTEEETVSVPNSLTTVVKPGAAPTERKRSNFLL